MKAKVRYRHSKRLIAFPGSGPYIARQLRALALQCERGEVQFVIVGVYGNDGELGFFSSGRSSMIQRLGLLELARDMVLRDFEE